MTMTIGRTAIRVAAGFPQYNGDRMLVRGHILPSTDVTRAVLAARQQLRGYTDPTDESTVALTWTVDSSVNGWYRVISASVPDRGSVGDGAAYAEVELERFGTSFAGVQMECTGTSLTRVNAAGATSAGIWAIPQAVTAFDPPVSWKTLALAARTADTGALHVIGVNTSTSAMFGRFTIAPGSAYVGAAVVEDNFGGSTFYPLVGRHHQMSASSWRLNNGLIRVTPSATSGQLFEVSTYNGATWSTPVAFAQTCSDGAAPGSRNFASAPVLVSARVLRNSPEASAVRLGFRYTTATSETSVANENKMLWQTQVMDISLRRGARIAEIDISNGSGLGYAFMTMNGTPAGTALTGGVKATATDASGNTGVIMTAGTIATVPTTMTLRVSGAATFHWAIGYETPTGASAPHAAADLVQQYVGAIAEKQRAVLA